MGHPRHGLGQVGHKAMYDLLNKDRKRVADSHNAVHSLAERGLVERDLHQVNGHIIKHGLKVFVVAGEFWAEGR
jgi:hypothetical protein